ncbi:MAG TPA: hypothetical protein DEH78_28065 [Solibacterales bacterium]|nr:hypothetical protein [Bryobacterales bacterium]
MKRIGLFHWRPAEAAARVEALERLGYKVDLCSADPQGSLRKLRAAPPQAVVVDLSRLPSHGRAVAFMLRQSPRTRALPLVFAGGPPDKVARVRSEFPDAAFCEWDAIAKALRSAAPGHLVPTSASGFDSAKPLARKLGVKDGATIGLVDAPDGFEGVFESCAGVDVRRDAVAGCKIVVAFVSSQALLEYLAPRIVPQLDTGAILWIAYPKKAGKARSDLSMAAVRAFLLAFDWVDFKVCSIDGTWTGMGFGRRRPRP